MAKSRHQFIIFGSFEFDRRILTLMVEISQSTGSHGNQNEKKNERPQNFHNKPHLEQKENANIIPSSDVCLNFQRICKYDYEIQF